MDTRGGNTWHTTEPWHNSPLPEGVSHAVTVPPGRGGGALEAPQDRHGQEHRTGTSRAEQITEAIAELGALETMALQGAQEAMAGGPCGRGLGPLGPYIRNPFYPPPQKKISLGKLGGIRSPPGLNTDTGQPSGARHTGQDSPPGTGSPPGLARKLRLLLGMTRSQGPSQGPSATASTSATRGQAAGNGLRGHYKKSRLPQMSLLGQDRQDTLKLFLRARQDLKTMTMGTWHGTPGRDVDWIHGTRVSGDPAGLIQRRSGGLDSAAIRRAWVSGDPAGLSQRRAGRHWVRGDPAGLSQQRSGGLESEAGRRALSQRRAGGHWVRGDPAGIESEAGRRALSQRRSGGHWVRGGPACIESEAGPRALSQRRSGGLESEAIRRALSQRRSGGHWVRGDPAGIESEAGRQALSQRRSGGHWVRGGPAGIESEAGPRALSQRRSGGLESEAIRRALSQRRAGRHWVRGDPAGLSQRRSGGLESEAESEAIRRAWGSGTPGTREPAGRLGIATAGGGYLPRSAGMRACGQRTRLPRETKHRNKTKTRKNKQNKTRWRGAAYG